MNHISKSLSTLSSASGRRWSILGVATRLGFVRSYSQIKDDPKIAVIGAGPAGLTLARLLQHLIPPSSSSSSSSPSSLRPQITILESDPSPNCRDQGGSLDLHPDGGQAALKLAGLFPQFQSLARPEGEVLKIYLPDGKLIMDEGSDPESQGRPREMHDRPEIDRRLLRQMLLDSLEPGTVRWGTKVKGIVPKKVDGGGREVFDIRTTTSSSSAPVVGQKQEQQEETILSNYDVIIGADGAFSRVRPLLTPARPYFSGIAGLDVRITSVDTSRPLQATRCGKGMCLTLGPNRGILSQRSGAGAGEVRTYAFVRMAAEGLEGADWQARCGIDFADMKSAIPLFMDRFYSGWDDGARDMVLKADTDTAVPRTMWMLEPGLRWESRPGLTLLGDAAHLMTPFAGVGVNVAMQDSLNLAQRIISHLSSSSDTAATTTTQQQDPSMALAIKEYETEMFERAEKYAKKTLMYLDLFFHDRGGIAMVEHFDKVKAGEKKAAAAAAAAAGGESAGNKMTASG